VEERLFDLLQTLGAVLVKNAGLRGRNKLLLDAIKEFDVEHVLKGSDVLTDTGLRQVKFVRRGSHALGPKDTFKDPDMIQIDVIDDHK
jgi:hypothetical protein